MQHFQYCAAHLQKGKPTSKGTSHEKTLLQICLTLGLTTVGGAAFAAGAGTGIESGFTDVGTDLNTLLGGAGGFIIVIISISIAMAVLMLAIGRGWGSAVTAFAVAMFLGYGVTALQGISGVSATTDLLMAELVVEEPSAENGKMLQM